ncbi:MAG: COX15/CtaA family protein [Thermoanaerobaculaceae bacterium]|jgi:cytochrome c oxidase assembly protein subunit 15
MATKAQTVSRRGDILTLGFGTSVAMWFLGYVCRMPSAPAPSWALGLGLLACLAAGGYVAGRLTDRGWTGGLAAGLLSSAINLLILGSLLGGDRANQVVPSALWWLPGSLVLGAGVAAAGAIAGRSTRRRDTRVVNWTGAFAGVAAAATLLQLLVGGFVTGNKAGLSVVDWPNSFGYNMFLYPLSRMTGGVYYEHAHRLFGSLVGLTTVALAAHLLRSDRRSRVKRLALVAVLAVIVQGILGGLRVTGGFTASTSPEAMAPSITLAIVHGVLGPAFFALVVAIAVLTSTTWNSGVPARASAHAGSEHVFGLLLVGAVAVQLLLGAIQRHLARGLMVHITFAVAVLALALLHGSRLWGLYEGQPLLQRLGRLIMTVAAVQVSLGILAFFAVQLRVEGVPRPGWDVLLTTAHQACGSVLLGCSVMGALWSRRLLVQAEADAERRA